MIDWLVGWIIGWLVGCRSALLALSISLLLVNEQRLGYVYVHRLLMHRPGSNSAALFDFKYLLIVTCVRTCCSGDVVWFMYVARHVHLFVVADFKLIGT